jgi:hypothetical protein
VTTPTIPPATTVMLAMVGATLVVARKRGWM